MNTRHALSIGSGALRIVFIPSLLLLHACAGMPGGPPNAGPSLTAGSDAIANGTPLISDTHVTDAGAYQTGFAFPVPAAPGEPQVSLNYNSQANGTLVGAGWDLSIGYPISIMRDLRFGTPQWTFDANWLWGNTPLVRLNPKTCGAKCDYRTAPDASIGVTLDLTAPPVNSQTRQERATVRLPNGTTLDYEPIYYDGTSYPAAPAGADTIVLGFRLASVTDRNGYTTCYRYQTAVAPADVSAQLMRGRIAPLEDIAYGGGTAALRAQTCVQLFANTTWPSFWHRVHFEYDSLSALGYASTWSARYGAPVAFDSMLKHVAIAARGASKPQDEFYMQFLSAHETETRRPLLRGIAQTVPVDVPGGTSTTSTRIVRTFAYGSRNLQFDAAQLVDIGEPGRFPPSISGVVSRPVRRASIFGDDNVFDAGQDQDSDAAPPTHATTEQWSLMDVNGDGLVDLQWGREKGADPARQWSTFEPAPPIIGASGVDVSQRTPQQQILVNEGILGANLVTTRSFIDSHSLQLEGEAPHTGSFTAGYFSLPTSRSSIPLGVNEFTSWIWGEGRGETRTGMPMSISAAEITKPATACPHNAGQDPRHWPMYPDKTFSTPSGSFGIAMSQTNVLDPGSPTYAGFPGASNIIDGIYKGYDPTYSVSATVSGWADLDGDGIPEFVATPSWIERFGLDYACAPFNDPQEWPAQILQEKTLDSYYAHEPSPATLADGTVDTRWHVNTMPALADGATFALDLDSPRSAFPPARMFGPPGPVGLPFSYDVSTGSSEGFGVTLPISSLAYATASCLITESWIPIAAAAPGLTVETFAPRGATGYRMSIATPSETGMAQGAASMASNGVSAGSVAEFAMSVVRINFDYTVLSTTERNRAETRAQMMDINADGLPDYLLYDSGGAITMTDSTGASMAVPRGSLVAFLSSPSGAFGGPVIINRGFDYPSSIPNSIDPTMPMNVPDLDTIDLKMCQALTLSSQLTRILTPLEAADTRCLDAGVVTAMALAGNTTVPPDQACKAVPVPLSPTCAVDSLIVSNIADRADAVMALAKPFMNLTKDAIPREKSLLDDIDGLTTFIRGFGDTLTLHPDIVSVDVTTAAARALVADLGFVARTVRHIGYSSRVNVVSEGFSELDGARVDQTAAGITAQTKGFVDLNGDGLPDYVQTDDRESLCPPGSWQVLWGTGTSSIQQGRAFLLERNSAGGLAPSCVMVPAAPAEVIAQGYATLPMNVDRVSRAPTPGNQIDTQVDSFVSLNDVNRDGRPDLIIAGDVWDQNASSQTWHVFLNTGSGFETTPIDIQSPTSSRSDVEPASTHAKPGWLTRNGLDVPYPAVRTSHSASTVIGSIARDTSETHAAMVDIDGDGVPEMIRRVHILKTATTGEREGMLVWRRSNVGGPQDLMIEDRDPIAGRRTLVEYRTAADFQWPDAMPDGKPPADGHHNLMGVSGQLVRSTTDERVIGDSEQRTRTGYDYKRPLFDMATRSQTGFAMRSSFALDPLPDNPMQAKPIKQSLLVTNTSAQRLNGLPGRTHSRSVVAATGAPVLETLTSYLETSPTTLCPGVGSFASDGSNKCPALGGLQSIFAAPDRVLRVEYPTSVATAPILDLSFDGRAPWRDAVSGRGPQMPAADCAAFNALLASAPDASEATGGAVRLSSTQLPVSCGSPQSIQYDSPIASGGNGTASPLTSGTLEAWIEPDAPAADEVVAELPGAMRLLIVNDAGAWHWRLQVGTSVNVTSAGPDDLLAGHWQHVVATFGGTGARIFLNGRRVADSTLIAAPIPAGAFVVGCGSSTNGTAPGCFNGALGELRLYAEYWPQAPRVTDTETEMIAPAGCVFDAAPGCPGDFAQTHLVRHHNDLADAGDDVVTEFEYAVADPVANDPRHSAVLGLVSSEAEWIPKPDGSPSQYLSFTAHAYDGLAQGHAVAGNETQRSKFDGVAQAQKPSVANLRVKSLMAYDPDCPGIVSATTDPLGAVTRTTWDASCAFPLSIESPLGMVSHTQYYGVADSLSPVTGVLAGPYGSYPLRGHFGQSARSIDPNGAQTLTTYDEWGRMSAGWAPLDRVDRPGTLMEYADACSASGVNAAHCAPSRVATSIWDDELPRCIDSQSAIVACSNVGAVAFAAEQPPGGYRTTYQFGDGQLQAQSVNSARPAWTTSGTADFDSLGRMSRAYKISYLPSSCPNAGQWCDSASISDDPLRTGAAEVQLAYDARGRQIRTYGPAWPKCAGDPSAVTSAVSSAPDCDQKSAGVNDVTKLSYPAPGDTVILDANNVPTLEHTDSRGLVTLTRDYVLPGPNAPPATPPVPYSSVALAYDPLGRLVSSADESGNTTLHAYDALSRLRSVTDPDLGQTTYEYDLRSALTDSVVASGEKTHHEYDVAGRLVQTDYLRPRQVSGGSDGPTLNLPSDTVPGKIPFPYCYDVPGLSEPSHWEPAGGWGDPPPDLVSLSLAGDGPVAGQGSVVLPFDLDFMATSGAGMTNGPLPGGAAARERASRSPARRTYHFARGTPLVIGADGHVAIAAGSVRASFNMLDGAPLTLAKNGIRYAIFGAQGARRLVVEWRGAIAERAGETVVMRMTIGERSPIVRYEFERVPPHLRGGMLTLLDARGQFQSPLTPPAGGDGQFLVSGSAFSFGDLPDARAYRIHCDRVPDETFDLPFRAGNARGQRLKLGYRVFSACGNGAAACRGNFRIGYRASGAKNGTVQPLTVVSYAERPANLALQSERGLRDTIDVALPDDLRGQKFDLVIEANIDAVHISGAKLPHDFDILWPGRTGTVYDPEERVHRTYDSTEPPFYIATQAGAQFETKPLLDLTFDTPGVVTDRSPSRASFSLAMCAPGADAGNFVGGASGFALSISQFSDCSGTLPAGISLSQFTAELWVEPHCQVSCPGNNVLAVGQIFSIALQPDGRVTCTVGNGSVTSNDPLTAGVWTHVALTFDSARAVRCSVNGVAQGAGATGSIAANATATSLRLGERRSTGAPVDVDEVRLIGYARSAAEVLADALRPLDVGAPRGNLLHIDFAHDAATAGGCPNNSACAWQRDQSQARNDAAVIDGKIVPGIQGMVFDTRSARPTGPVANLPAPTGELVIAHSNTLHLADAVTPELWLKTTSTQSGAARLMGKWAGPTAPGWRLQMTPSGRLRWEVAANYAPPGGGGVQFHRSVFITQETVSDFSWHHIAATYDGQRMRVFKDGVPMHRWCGSGPREGAQQDPPDIESCLFPPPAATGCTPIETKATDLPVLPGQKQAPRAGDTECIRGIIDNTEPVLVANDAQGEAFDGFLDEVRLSNYAKREFEVAASARLASAFTHVLGRETGLRNRFIILDGKRVGPASNDEPYDLAWQPARERRAFDLRGRLASAVKHVAGQRSADEYFLARSTADSLSRMADTELPHGEVLVGNFDVDGTQKRYVGFGPGIGQTPAQSQAYVAEAVSTITGRPARMKYGNGVISAWTYDDAAVPAAQGTKPTGAFGPDSLRTSVIKSGAGSPLSDRVYDWDGVGNLKHISDSSGGAGGTGQYDAEYGYDDLRRVMSASLSLPQQAPLNLAYDYDALGNLTLIDGKNAQRELRLMDGARQSYGRATSATCATAPNTLPHAMTDRTVLSALPSTETTDALCYDASGRLVHSVDTVRNSINTYGYFARGKIRSIVDRNGESDYLYDGNGERVAKTEQTGFTQFMVNPGYREIVDSGTPASIPVFEATYGVAGLTVARRLLSHANGTAPLSTATTDLNWFGVDQIHGTLLMTDAQGQEVANSRAFYRPFGGFVERTQPPQSDASGHRLFAGKELDATGLYDFGARLYDPLTGRFTQADDVTPHRGSQDQNRYSYVLNNPLHLVDPDGHEQADAKTWPNNQVRPTQNSEADAQLAATRAGVGARVPLHDRAALDAKSDAYFSSPESYVVEEADKPPSIFNYVPGARAGWLAGEVWTGRTISDAPTRYSFGDVVNLAVDDWVKLELLAAGSGFLGSTAGEYVSFMRAQAAQEAWWGEQMTMRARLESAAEPLNPRSQVTKAGSAWNAHSQGARGGASSFPPYRGNPAAANQTAQQIAGEILNSKDPIVLHYGDGITAVYDPATGRGAAFDANNNFLGFRDMQNPQFRVRTDIRAP